MGAVPSLEIGEIELPSLLRAMHDGVDEDARRGADIAMDWLHIDT